MLRGKVEITTHAKQRLAERMPNIHPSNYYDMVRAARYKGESKSSLWKTNPRLAQYICQRFYSNHSTEVRVYKDHVFVFAGNHGHSRTLKTVVNIHEKVLAEI